MLKMIKLRLRSSATITDSFSAEILPDHAFAFLIAGGICICRHELHSPLFFIFRGHAKNFCQCGLPRTHFINDIIKKQFHPLIFLGIAGYFYGRFPLQDHITDIIIDLQHFRDTHTAFVPGTPAMLTALAFI